jgi:dienelactone hydrolase
VIIIPDWDGVNEYEQTRATLVTEEWNMVGFAADIYGAGLQTVANITERSELANLYRSDPILFAERIKAAVDLIRAHEKVNPDQVAIFGYCFGGTGVLQYGLMGYDGVNAVVSFHGGLSQIPEPNATFVPKVLLLSGGDDDTSTQIMDMEITLDAADAPWEITRYSGIEHAFTVWSDDRYNEWADMRSWESAGHFILEAFGITEFMSAQPEEELMLTEVNYTGVDGTPLTGHLAMPGPQWQRPLPAVVVFPDWDGVNDYEKERAYALAQEGYVAFAADIYGSDKQFVAEIPQRVEEVTKYRSDPDLYVSRMQNAIDQVKALTDDVDPDEIAIIGYCFGGSGVVLYSMSNTTDAKVSVPFHGSFEEMPAVQGDIASYVLV